MSEATEGFILKFGEGGAYFTRWLIERGIPVPGWSKDIEHAKVFRTEGAAAKALSGTTYEANYFVIAYADELDAIADAKAQDGLDMDEAAAMVAALGEAASIMDADDELPPVRKDEGGFDDDDLPPPVDDDDSPPSLDADDLMSSADEDMPPMVMEDDYGDFMGSSTEDEDDGYSDLPEVSAHDVVTETSSGEEAADLGEAETEAKDGEGVESVHGEFDDTASEEAVATDDAKGFKAPETTDGEGGDDYSDFVDMTSSTDDDEDIDFPEPPAPTEGTSTAQLRDVPDEFERLAAEDDEDDAPFTDDDEEGQKGDVKVGWNDLGGDLEGLLGEDSEETESSEGESAKTPEAGNPTVKNEPKEGSDSGDQDEGGVEGTPDSGDAEDDGIDLSDIEDALSDENFDSLTDFEGIDDWT